MLLLLPLPVLVEAIDVVVDEDGNIFCGIRNISACFSETIVKNVVRPERG